MLTLINTNLMTPPISPIGLDYIATHLRKNKIETNILDLALADDPDKTLTEYFNSHDPQLVGLSFRNVDDCFWPSAKSFFPDLVQTVHKIKRLTEAPIVIGGVGFSIFPEQIVEHTGADFGICGDGEHAIFELLSQLQNQKLFDRVEGLIWRENNTIRSNIPAWPQPLSLPVSRDAIDNLQYFKRGGQGGLETKRGCNRQCIYCVDPLAKGQNLRLRDPAEVADEAEALLAQGVDVLHTCDSEFNIPYDHALEVCGEFNRRQLGDRLRWYTYMAVKPFDAQLAQAMSKAGCVGIDFTADSASPSMLKTYRQPHLKQDLASAVRLCKQYNIKPMFDLLLGGPGETPDSTAETINFIKQIDPYCAGASLGIRIYPGTEMARITIAEGPLEQNPAIRRKYEGPIDFFKPTFYISASLGDRPAELVRDLIAGDKRFFEPTPEITSPDDTAPTDHNYNDNTQLVNAINTGARGAYWHILRQTRDS
jgi:radical SAM superfamily enzyme YgiQ (UPF0313 family)